MKTHRYYHTNEKPFKCSECNYETESSSNLRTHIRHVHFLDRNFKCTYPGCNKAYLYPSWLRAHMKYHDPNRVIKKKVKSSSSNKGNKDSANKITKIVTKSDPDSHEIFRRSTRLTEKGVRICYKGILIIEFY